MSESYTVAASPSALAQAYGLARGVYQRNLLDGNEAWSGSTLRGAAGSYGGRYKASRENLIQRIRAAGIPFRFEFGKRGRKIAVIG